MNEKAFTGFHTDAALQWLGNEIQTLAKHSNQTTDAVAARHHLSKHTIGGV